MSKTFVTADLHLGHENIIGYTDRPFASVEEMDARLVENWNKVVRSNDRVFVIGDFCHGKGGRERAIAAGRQMNGHKILIEGNHDFERGEPRDYEDVFKERKTIETIKHRGRQIVLFHYPMESWNGAFHGAMHFHGHVHGGLRDRPGAPWLRLDVGVDCFDYTPITLDQAFTAIEDQVARRIKPGEQYVVIAPDGSKQTWGFTHKRDFVTHECKYASYPLWNVLRPVSAKQTQEQGAE